MRYSRKISVGVIILGIVIFGLWTRINSKISITTYGRDSRHTYKYEDKEFKGINRILWKQQLDSQFSTEVLAYKDKIICGTEKSIVALNKNNGEQIWKVEANLPTVQLNSGIYVMPAVIRDDVVYFPDKNSIKGVDINNGKEVWNYTIELATMNGIPVVDNNNIYFSCNDGSFYAVNIKSKKVQWKYNSVELALSPAIDNGVIYINTVSSIIALDAKKGKEQWVYRGKWTATQIHIDSQRIYAHGISDDRGQTFFGALAAIDKKSGKEIWSKKNFNLIYQLAMDENSLLCQSMNVREGNKTQLKSYDKETGEEKHLGNLGEWISSNISIINNSIILSGSDNKIRNIDMEAQKELSKIEIGSGLISAPVIHDGRVYFSEFNLDEKAYIYCIE